MVLPADDLRDFEVDVIGAGSQVIGRHAVGAQEGKVLDVFGELGLFAEDAVVESDDDFLPFRARHTVAQDEGLAGGGTAIALLSA